MTATRSSSEGTLKNTVHTQTEASEPSYRFRTTNKIISASQLQALKESAENIMQELKSYKEIGHQIKKLNSNILKLIAFIVLLWALSLLIAMLPFSLAFVVGFAKIIFIIEIISMFSVIICLSNRGQLNVKEIRSEKAIRTHFTGLREKCIEDLLTGEKGRKHEVHFPFSFLGMPPTLVMDLFKEERDDEILMQQVYALDENLRKKNKDYLLQFSSEDRKLIKRVMTFIKEISFENKCFLWRMEDFKCTYIADALRPELNQEARLCVPERPTLRHPFPSSHNKHNKKIFDHLEYIVTLFIKELDESELLPLEETSGIVKSF